MMYWKCIGIFNEFPRWDDVAELKLTHLAMGKYRVRYSRTFCKKIRTDNFILSAA